MAVEPVRRRGFNSAQRFPRIVEGLARLKVSSRTFDGEAVVCDQDAASDFDKLHSEGYDDQVVLYAFDLLEVNGTTGDLGRCRSARPSLRIWESDRWNLSQRAPELRGRRSRLMRSPGRQDHIIERRHRRDPLFCSSGEE